VKKNISYFIVLISFFVLTSCDHNTVFDKNEKIPDYKWEMNNIIKLDAQISDTVSAHNIYINVRNESGYQFSNLFLFLTTQTPKGEIARDTVELTLSDERGNWLGDGSGDIRDNRILFRKKFRFTEAGLWHFELEQAMRINPLPGIMDVGLRIEKAKAN
jgi:gliding motility-associated lipoprotein GldH